MSLSSLVLASNKDKIDLTDEVGKRLVKLGQLYHRVGRRLEIPSDIAGDIRTFRGMHKRYQRCVARKIVCTHTQEEADAEQRVCSWLVHAWYEAKKIPVPPEVKQHMRGWAG